VSATRVSCDDDFCTSTYNGLLPDCKKELPCQYNVVYGDGSSTAGYFVSDTVQFERVTGNLQTGLSNGTVTFGSVAVLLLYCGFVVLNIFQMLCLDFEGLIRVQLLI